MNAATLAGPALLALSVMAVGATGPRLAAIAHDAKKQDDVATLPPPAMLHVLTLGWDAAVVDLLWSELLIDYGTHWSEHRDLKYIPSYVDAILELEPTYGPMYRFVDTLLAYRPLRGTEADVRLARGYLERGTRARPDDARVWLEYGQFLSFIAPSFLEDSGERDAWRRAGATAVGHAVELGADADSALSAATMLTAAGARDQAIRFLEHAYELTPEASDVHDSIGRRLASLEANAWRDAADEASAAIDMRWTREMPLVPRDRYLLIGPRADVWKCAGPDTTDDPACDRDWASIIGRARAVTGPEWSEGSR
ncbi:MAG: hypothetical protein ABSC94_15610 [Polyangiaceae bacterium]|jgi:hypothetical protein